MIRRTNAVVSGRVQGVGFRASARAKAKLLGLGGFARNLGDGRVEVEAEGEEEAVAEFIRWLSSGPRFAAVRAVDLQERQPTGDRGFTVF